MRNLKRALSLTLASVMLLGMMVVGSSAAAGYDDVADTDNVEAIEVLQAIEVMVGDERGFGPDRPVNRAEMAVVMGKLLNLDYNYYATSCPFDDVYDWARGWVGACYANKIVSGRGEGVYDPGATVTAVEAASMLMRALGYFQYANDVADGFELSTVRQGTKIGIFDGVGSSATLPMTRNQVAQMVLNALQSDVVEPDGNTINLTTPDGTVLTGKVNYVSVTRDEVWATAIDDTEATSVGSQNSGYIVELGERLYNGELKLYKYRSDDFERPARTWEYDGKEIGTYMKKENIRAEYTDGVNRRELYDLLGSSSLDDYALTYYVDGVVNGDINKEAIRTRITKDFGTTGRGVLTQVFVDIEKKTIDITSINTWLAKAAADYNETRESVVLNVYNNYVGNKTSTIAKTVKLVDVPEIADVTKDQYVLVNWSGKDQPANIYEVVDIANVEILSDSTLTKFSNGNDDEPNSDKTGYENIFKSVTTNGTEYKNSKKAFYSDEALELYNNNLLTNKTYNIYLDKYGYAIGVDLFSGDDNYVFISGVKLNNSTIAMTQADANAIFTDGTSATIKVNVKDTDKNIETVKKGTLDGEDYFEKWNSATYNSDLNKATLNRWYTYTVDNNNVYTLTPAARMVTTNLNTAETIKCDSVVLDMTDKDTNNTAPHPADGTTKRIYGNDDSIYIIPELDNVSGTGVSDKVISGVDGRYTGVQSVEIDVAAHSPTRKIKVGSDTTELYDSVYAVYDKNDYVIAAVIVGEAKGTSANYAYILSAAKSEEKIDDTYYWEFDAIVDGAKQTLTVKSKFANTINALMPGHMQELRYNDEYVSAIKNINEDKFYTNYTQPINRNTHEVYEVGHVERYRLNGGSGRYGECQVDCSFGGYDYPDSARLNSTTAPNLHFDGRTLYLGAEADRGLTFVTDAPAVVIHYEDGYREVREFTSVSAALAVLGDADGNDTNGKLGFAGRLTAALNSQGVAKWVVIESDTPVGKTTSGGQTPTTPKPDVKALPFDATIDEVNRLLAGGSDVVIEAGSKGWVPSDLAAGKDTVVITDGRHLYIDGNLNIMTTKPREGMIIESSTNNAKLTVTGTLTIGHGWMDDFTGTANVGSLVVDGSDTSEVNCGMTVNRTVSVATGATLEIYQDMTVYNNGGAANAVAGNGTVEIYAHVEVARGDWDVNITKILHPTSLVLSGGAVNNVVILGNGSASYNGHLEGLLASTATLIYKNTASYTQALSIPTGVTVVADAPMTIENIAAGAVLIARADVTITGTMATGDVVLAKNTDIVLAENANVAQDAVGIVKDASSANITGDVGTKVTISGGSDGAITSSGAKSANDNIATTSGGNTEKTTVTSETPAPLPDADVKVDEVEMPITVASNIAAVTGLPEGATQEVEISENGNSISVVVKKALNLAVTGVQNATVGETALSAWYNGVTGQPDKLVVLKITGNTKMYLFKSDWTADGYANGVWIEMKDADEDLDLIVGNNKTAPMRIAFAATDSGKTVTGQDGVKVYNVAKDAEYAINVNWTDAVATPASPVSEP